MSRRRRATSHDETVFGGIGIQTMDAVASSGSVVVAVGYEMTFKGVIGGGAYEEERDAAVWTSTDGIAWTRVTHDEEIFGGGDGWVSMASVVRWGPGFVGVGSPSVGGEAAVWVNPPPD